MFSLGSHGLSHGSILPRWGSKLKNGRLLFSSCLSPYVYFPCTIIRVRVGVLLSVSYSSGGDLCASVSEFILEHRGHGDDLIIFFDSLTCPRKVPSLPREV